MGARGQVVAPKGSVYIQDTRCWHASAMCGPAAATSAARRGPCLRRGAGRYVPEGERMAMVNRWCPWWLSVQVRPLRWQQRLATENPENGSRDG